MQIKSDYEILQSVNNSIKQKISSTNTEGSEKEFDELKREKEQLLKLVKCEVCHLRMKDVIISKCSHTFCRACVEKSLQSRQRTCLHCREKFSESDVNTI